MVAAWSAAVAAGAFVVLVIAVIIAIRSALIRLGRMQNLAEAIQQDLHKLSLEMSGILQPAEETVRTVNHQLQSVSWLFKAARQVGDTLEQTTSAIENAAAVLSQAARRHAERASEERQVDEAMQWAELGMTAWQLWQSRRGSAAGAGETDDSASNLNQ